MDNNSKRNTILQTYLSSKVNANTYLNTDLLIFESESDICHTCGIRGFYASEMSFSDEKKI